MPKMLINLRSDGHVYNFNDNDILLYDAKKDEFYTVTEEIFFAKMRSELNKVIKDNEETVKKLKDETEAIKKENAEFMKKIQKINEDLIEMVKNFISQQEGK